MYINSRPVSYTHLDVYKRQADILEQLGISYEMTIISAHREPDVFFEYAKSAELSLIHI